MYSRLLALLAVVCAVGTVSGKDCGYGTEVNGCCVCHPGYITTNNASCAGCAPGYDEMTTSDGRVLCGAGRNGTRCEEGQAAPWGCGVGGACSAEGKFPCTRCPSGYSLESNCALKEVQPGGCEPSGPRMFAPFPYEPVVGKPFSLVITGCNLQTSDRYIVIPAHKDDEDASENRCEDVQEGAIGANCTLEGGSAGEECRNGYAVTTVRRPNAEQRVYGEVAITNVTFTEEMLGRGDKGKYRRLCVRTTRVLPGGKTVETWRAVDAHNHHVNRRSDKFLLADEVVQLRGAGEEGGASGEGCCDGLKVGSLCLPLWAFLLLWLLMAALLGVLGYALHKNKQEIEAEKNNRKYEKFATDAEMANLAAKRDTDDDDI